MSNPFIREETVAAVQVTKEWLKVAQVRVTRNGKKLSKVAIKHIGSDSDEETSRVLRELMNELKPKPTILFTCISRNQVTIRLLRLPSTDKAEIARMIDFQATRQILYPKEEIITDYKVIGKDAEGYSRVLLVIVHQPVVNHLLAILKGAGLEPARIDLSSEAIGKWYLSAQGTSAEEKRQDIVLIDIDALATEFIVVSGTDVIFSRSISLGSLYLREKVDIKTKFIDEIRRSFTAYQMEWKDQRTAKIIVTGGEGEAGELIETLKSEFSLPVETIEPFENIEVAQEILSPAQLRQQGISVSAVVGLALGRRSTTLDLLPPEVKRNRQQRSKRREFARMGSLLVCLLLVGIALSVKKIYDRQTWLDQLDTQIRKTAPIAEEVEKMKQRAEIIKDQLDRRLTCLDIIRELYTIVPKELALSAFTYEEDRQVTLRGTSKQMSDVFKFISILEESPYFKNVQIRYASKRKVMNEELTDFQINCPLEEF